MSKFGQRLQRVRLEKQLSRRGLESAARIPHGIVSRLESERPGVQAYPSIPVARRLAKVLGVTLDYLCGMNEEEWDSELMAALAS